MICCGIVQYINMFGTSIGYTVTGGLALVYARPAACPCTRADAPACSQRPCQSKSVVTCVRAG